MQWTKCLGGMEQIVLGLHRRERIAHGLLSSRMCPGICLAGFRTLFKTQTNPCAGLVDVSVIKCFVGMLLGRSWGGARSPAEQAKAQNSQLKLIGAIVGGGVGAQVRGVCVNLILILL